MSAQLPHNSTSSGNGAGPGNGASAGNESLRNGAAAAAAPSPAPDIELIVDGRAVSVPEGATLLEATRRVDADVPVLCYHETLNPIGACRVCVVEVEGSRTLQPACQRRAEAGMVVHTDSERVQTSRRMVVELLQTSAATDRAPEILRRAEQYGAEPARWRPIAVAAGTHSADPASGPHPAADGAGTVNGAHLGPRSEPVIDNELYVRDLDRCIMCYRCVEACGEQVQNSFAIAPAGRGSDIFIDAGYLHPLPESDCVFCGNCVAVCPTGALIFATEFEMREAGTWQEEEQTVTQTTCPYCGVGCQIELHVQDNRIVKATAPVEDPITSGYLCVKGRFGWEYVHSGLDDAQSTGPADGPNEPHRPPEAPPDRPD